MRLESQNNGRQATFFGNLQRAFENGLMTAVNPVEIADCHHTIVQVSRQGIRSRKALKAGFGHFDLVFDWS
uniref:Uncharacterized protein n=1 Tax=Ochrobactrum sp. PW1 TaxID=1882222 RepID=A0A292GQQ4_9HYPH|nr:hypothetical protein [Ochrobactrum sp. PW1]